MIGTGYGAYESARASRVFGDLLPTYQRGRMGMVAVATGDGAISWCPSQEIEIVKIDGISVGEVLRGYDVAASAADLEFPVATADEIQRHPQFPAFALENKDWLHLPDDRVESDFRDWQCQRKRRAELGAS